MPVPNVDWNRPEGVPTNGAALWADPTWRDLDEGALLLLRSKVVAAMTRDLPPPEPEQPTFGLAALSAAAVGLGVAAASRKKKRR